MAKKIFKADLSISSIKKMQSDLRKYRNSLEYKARQLAETLAERGVEIARVHVSGLDAIFEGDLIQSIHSEYMGTKKSGAVFAIVADDESAIFVEMGTGLVGARHPYPGKLPAVYAQGQHFVKLEKPLGKFPAGTYGWFYLADDGNIYFTEGMPSRPFLYETANDLMDIVEEEAKKIFGK